MSPRMIWVARILLVVGSLAVSALFGEWAVALMAPQNLSLWEDTRDGMTIHRSDLDVYWPKFDLNIRTNSLGMRDREHSLEKPAGLERVLVLGDSFMEAIQVPYEDSFPAILEHRLNRDGRPVEVINLSVSGWGTDDEVTYLERHGMAMDPDVVLIMMTLHNDVADNALQKFHTLDAGGLRARPMQEVPLTRHVIQKIKAYMAGTSHLWQLAYQTSMRQSVQVGAKQLDRHVASLLRHRASPDLERNWALTLALLDKAERLVEAHGASLVIGLIPLRVQVQAGSYREFVAELGASDEEMERTAPQRRVKDWAGRRDVPVVDLLPAFASRSAEGEDVLYLADDGHWSVPGHVLAAEQAARVLVPTAQ